MLWARTLGEFDNIYLYYTCVYNQILTLLSSKLSAAVEKLTSGSSGSTGSFTGKGQSLGGGPAPATVPGADTPGVINLSPQAKVFLSLVGVYLLLWYFS